MFAGKEVGVLSAAISDEGQDRSLKHLIDPTMLKKYPSELVDSVDRIVGACLKKDPEARLAMDEIVLSVSRIMGNSFDLGFLQQLEVEVK